jgi:hypothetical protein
MRLPLRLLIAPFVVFLGIALLVASALLAVPASAATTGAGISGITPYGGYLGNYIAPDGSRVYCIDSNRDWPSGTTGPGAETSTLATGWGEQLSAQTLQKFNYALNRYGQTADPVQAAAMNAYLYAYTSGYTRTHGASFDAGLHYIDGNVAVTASYSTIWNDVERLYNAVPDPTAQVIIHMSDPREGTVEVTTTPAGVPGTLTLSGAVVTANGASAIAVTGGTTVAIEGIPAKGATAYTIRADASFVVDIGPGPLVTVFETGSQQRTIREGGTVKVDVASSTQVAVELPPPPVPTPTPTPTPTDPPRALAKTGASPLGMLGAGLALLVVGSLTGVVRRPRE